MYFTFKIEKKEKENAEKEDNKELIWNVKRKKE